MFNPLYISEAWLTFLMKGAYGLATGLIVWSGKKDWSYLKATLATVAGAVTYAVLYLGKSFLKGLVVQGLTADAAMLALIGKVPATIFNAVVAIIFAPILAQAIRAALQKSRITLD